MFRTWKCEHLQIGTVSPIFRVEHNNLCDQQSIAFSYNALIDESQFSFILFGFSLLPLPGKRTGVKGKWDHKEKITIRIWAELKILQSKVDFVYLETRFNFVLKISPHYKGKSRWGWKINVSGKNIDFTKIINVFVFLAFTQGENALVSFYCGLQCF